MPCRSQRPKSGAGRGLTAARWFLLSKRRGLAGAQGFPSSRKHYVEAHIPHISRCPQSGAHCGLTAAQIP
eukprot:361296-Pelagomonas_calceolata.AAC.6